MGYRRGDFSSLLVRSSLPPSHSETPDTQAITREAKNVTYNQGLIQLPFKKRPMFTHAALLALYYRKIIWRSWKFLPSVCVEWRFGHAWKKNEHSAQSNHLLNLTKEGFQNKNTRSQSHVGEHGLLRAK